MRRMLQSRTEPEVEHWPAVPEMIQEDAIAVYSDHSHLKLDSDLVRQLIARIIENEGKIVHHLEVVLTGSEQLRSLNKSWKNADYDTDVLSFSFGSDSAIDAVVYVSLDFARANCKSYGATFIQEASRYVVHGLLHLSGYEDDTPQSQQIMRQKEDHYLRHAGLICT